MRVLVDSSYAERGPSGTGVYVEHLVAALRESGAVEVHEARQRGRRRPGGGGLRSLWNLLHDLWWLHVQLPRAARAAEADVVHHPLPVHSRRIRVPQVATVHDLAPLRMPSLYDPRWVRLAGALARLAARHGGALVCVSEATARDARELLGAAPDRIVVAPHGPGQADRAAPVEAVAADGHLLYVGDAEPRKNLSGLLAAYAVHRAMAEDPAELVLAGAAAAAAGAPGVRGVPSPSPTELLDLLRGARALVHPSLHEGFGMTLLEAMTLGVPVVAVNSEGARELCGEAALLVEADHLSAGLTRIAVDGVLRQRLAWLGRERAAEFSWERSARAHERAYTLAAGAPAPVHEP